MLDALEIRIELFEYTIEAVFAHVVFLHRRQLLDIIASPPFQQTSFCRRPHRQQITIQTRT